MTSALEQLVLAVFKLHMPANTKAIGFADYIYIYSNRG